MSAWAKAKRQARRIKTSTRKRQSVGAWAKHVLTALKKSPAKSAANR